MGRVGWLGIWGVWWSVPSLGSRGVGLGSPAGFWVDVGLI